MAELEPPLQPPRARTLESAVDGVASLLLLVVGDGVYATEPLAATGRVVIGRVADNDVCIDDPSVSRVHAALHLDLPLRIEDLGSANGTYVHDQQLAPNTPREIQINEPVRIGSVSIIVQRRPTKLRTRRVRNHSYFEDRMEDECVRAARNRGQFVIVHIVVDRGVAGLQNQVAAVLRAGDIVASYAPHELEILLIDTNANQAERAVARLQDMLAEHEVVARIGSAAYPRDGRESNVLAARARDRAQGNLSLDADDKAVVADARMTALYKLVDRVAASEITVLLLGETGVGKEIVAEAIHQRSPRADKLLLRLNCAALTETLLESELFGHEKGAFTGAVATKPGLFESASGGTVFLDEVGELPLSTQAKLLRVLDQRKVMRVGSVTPLDIDVRLVAATNRDLDLEVRRGQFRLDLLYRLNAMSMIVPPLRERVTEIEPLARAFLRQIAARLERMPCQLTPAALELLQTYSWPGNVRELRNMMERAVILATGDRIDVGELPEDKMRSTFTTAARAGIPGPVVEVPGASGDEFDVQRLRLLAALDTCAGNQTNAAKLLGVSRRTLITWLEKFAVPRPRKPDGRTQ